MPIISAECDRCKIIHDSVDYDEYNGDYTCQWCHQEREFYSEKRSLCGHINHWGEFYRKYKEELKELKQKYNDFLKLHPKPNKQAEE
jgi:hypothetical protein